MQHAQTKAGFTLIEILIALAVFAILATITSSVLYHAFSTRTRVNEQSERFNELQVAISLLQHETSQIVERAIRGNEMRLFSAFIGQTLYLEFTRDGNVNPGSIEKRSTLQRIAYVCKQGTLLRRTWDTLDSINRNHYEEKPLLTHLSGCHFNYLDQNLHLLPEWKEQAVTLQHDKEPLPKAIQVNLSMHSHGDLNLLFLLPGALYATN